MGDVALEPVVDILHQTVPDVPERLVPDLVPGSEDIGLVRHPEQDPQHRDNHGERKDVEEGRKDVQHHGSPEVFLEGRYVAPHHLHEPFHRQSTLVSQWNITKTLLLNIS